MSVLVPEDKWVEVNDMRLHYLDWGNPSAQPLVLIHSYTSNAHYWDFFARRLINDYHVLVPELRGHGDSSWASCYNLDDGAVDIDEFFNSLKLKNVVLLGLSLGGLIAIMYAANQPDIVQSLIIVDIGPEIDADGIEHIQRDLASEPDFFDTEEDAYSHLKRVQPLHSDAFLKHQVLHSFRRGEDGSLRFKYDKAMCPLEMQSQEWLYEYLERIPCPTLVIRAAESDMLSRETAEKMVARLQNGSFTEVACATHNIVGDNPEGFEKAVREFLAVSV